MMTGKVALATTNKKNNQIHVTTMMSETNKETNEMNMDVAPSKKKKKTIKQKGTFKTAKKMKLSRSRPVKFKLKDIPPSTSLTDLEIEALLLESEEPEEQKEEEEEEKEDNDVVQDDEDEDNPDEKDLEEDDDDPIVEHLEDFMKENDEPLLTENAMRIAVAYIFVNLYDAEPDPDEKDLEEDDDDPIVEHLEDFMKENDEPLLTENAMRIAVAYIFVNLYDAEPDKSLWGGRLGIRTKIRNYLRLGKNTYLDNILNDVVACKKSGLTFTGKRADTSGRPPIIDLDSYEAQITADCIEAGFSIAHAWCVVNQYRKEQHLQSLTLAPVKSLIKRLKPLIKKIEKTRQGNDDENSKWCRARCNWDTQILIRTGKLKGKQLDYLKKNGDLPKWFDPEQMPKLHHEQIVWWDETHKKCTIGGQGSTNNFYARFPRDSNGKLDLKNGTYDETPIKKLNVKYEKEVRLCLGVAIVPSEGDTDVEVGVLAERFNYTGQRIKSIGDFANLKRELTKSIRNSKNTKKWTTSTRVFGTIYEDDSVTILTNLAEKTQEKLAIHNIKTVGMLKNLTNEMIELIDSQEDKTKRIAATKLNAFRTQAALAIPGLAPPVIDHRLAKNPWKSKYGEDDWEEEERKSPSLKSYVCITEVVEHIVAASAKLYKGTKYENTWMFYHDALSLMTAKKTVQWMKEKDYYKHWILPINDLHKDEADLKYYFDRPVGNCPENMPLDNSLNNDIHGAVKRHVNATWELHEDCHKKFSMSTPERGVYAYDRILTQVPSSKRIVQDILNVFKSMDLVRLSKGVLVDGVAKNYGKRYTSTGKKSLGGKRERQLADDDYDGGGGKWYHHHALDSVATKLADSRKRAAGESGTKAIIDKTMITTTI